eukprot:PhF_6_TR17034/c0_g6_i1/m.25888
MMIVTAWYFLILWSLAHFHHTRGSHVNTTVTIPSIHSRDQRIPLIRSYDNVTKAERSIFAVGFAFTGVVVEVINTSSSQTPRGPFRGEVHLIDTFVATEVITVYSIEGNGS